MSSTTPTISLCVITFDEQAMLPACLESAAPWVHQIVVVDTGSADETVQIAKNAGAEVVHHTWREDFSEARNAALEAATGEWILVLDADERLAPGAGEAIQAALSDAEFDCGLLAIHNANYLEATAEQVLSGLARRDDPVLVPRLLRRTPDLRWEGIVHESLGTWLSQNRTITSISAAIIHLGNVPHIREQRQKAERNLRLLERRCILEPKNPVVRTRLARELLRTGDHERASQEAEWAWMDLSVAWAVPDENRPKPGITEIATLRAFLTLNNREPEAALETADQAIAWGEEHPNIHLLRAAAIEQLNEHQIVEPPHTLRSALESLEYCLSRQGVPLLSESLPGATSWSALTLKGLILYRIGEYEQAKEVLQEALEAKVNHTPARLALAETLAALEHTEKAFDLLQGLLQTDQGDAWVIAAEIAFKKNSFEEVHLFLQRAEDHRTSEVISNHRKRKHRRLRLAVRAWTLYCRTAQKAFVAEKGDANHLVRTAEALFMSGDLDGATSRILQALSIDLLNATAWQDLAVVAHQLGLASGAKELLELALELDPTNSDILLNLAELCRAEGELPPAVENCRSILRNNPEDMEALHFLAELAIGGNNRPCALTVLSPSQDPIGQPLLEALRGLGYRVRKDHPALFIALGRRQHLLGGDEIQEQLRRIQPALAVLDVSCDRVKYWRPALTRQNVPVVLLNAENESYASNEIIAPSNSAAEITAFCKANVASAKPPPVSKKTVPFRTFLSVVITCRPDGPPPQTTLDSLAIQDLDPTLFEVIVLWVGYPAAPSTLQNVNYEFAIKHIHQGHPALASAWNHALHEARSPWLAFFQAGAVLPVRTLRHHLFTQASSSGHTIVIGPQKFHPRVHAERPGLARLLEGCDIWFPTAALGEEDKDQWRHVRLDNASVPRANLIALGGLDQQTFGPGTYPDAELILRMTQELAVTIDYEPSICVYLVTLPSARELWTHGYTQGYSQFLTWQKHPYEKAISIRNLEHPHDTEAFLTLRRELHERKPGIRQAREVTNPLWRNDSPTSDADLKRLTPITKAIQAYETLTGLVHAGTRLPINPDDEQSSLERELTSVVIVFNGRINPLKKTILSLKSTTQAPIELIIVDNNNVKRDRAWLQDQSDFTTLTLSETLSYAEAFNRGLEACHGSTVLVCAPGTIFTPGWRRILLGQLTAWPDIGAVGPVTNHGPAQQLVAFPDAIHDVDQWAAAYMEQHFGEYAYSDRLGLFCILFRRDVIEDIGGLKHGLVNAQVAEMDFCVRLSLAGWRMRIVSSCIVHCDTIGSALPSSPHESSLEPCWTTFKAHWNLATDAVYNDSMTLSSIATEHSFVPTLHQIPFRTAQGLMEDSQPLLLVPHRPLTTGV